jgi:4-hydroxy-tetrahydrodipicolinate synthase
MIFKGAYTALITPFKDGKVDEKAFADLVEWQISEGIHGLVPCGTTGESPTLSHEEHNRVIRLCVEVANKRVPVMAGTGSNSTDEAIYSTRHAKEAGADAALIVAPYYNRPSQEGLYQHFKALNDATEFPLVIYNIPGRSGVNITDDTIARMSELPYVVAVKDASGDLARVCNLRSKMKKPLQLFSGDDMTAVAFNATGGQGCISVASNLVPKTCAQVQELCFKGDYVQALKVHETLVELNNVIFCETNPTPVKYALSLMGKCTEELRLPLVAPSGDNKKHIAQVLKNLRLL